MARMKLRKAMEFIYQLINLAVGGGGLVRVVCLIAGRHPPPDESIPMAIWGLIYTKYQAVRAILSNCISQTAGNL